jgi:divalent metal cation (Fe/Co/Zn/Cd) transporter
MAPAGRDQYRSGFRVSAASVVWTVLASIASVVVGATLPSLSLIAFGAVGLFDAAGSVVLAMQFAHAHEHGDPSERLERLALRVIGVGLLAVGTVVAALSVADLSTGGPGARDSSAGVILAALSLVALSVLWLRKRRIARCLSSAALLADSRLSGVGAVLAAVTLGGTALTRAAGWWWVDPVAALGIGIAACRLGFLVRRGGADATRSERLLQSNLSAE